MIMLIVIFIYIARCKNKVIVAYITESALHHFCLHRKRLIDGDFREGTHQWHVKQGLGFPEKELNQEHLKQGLVQKSGAYQWL